MPITAARQFPLVSGFRFPKISQEILQGRVLCMARISQGLTRSELACKVGVTREAIRLWELGERSPEADFFLKLLKELKQEGKGFTIQERNPYKRQGTILWMARISQGLSLDQLAGKIGVSRETARQWEYGKRSPDAVMIKTLADTLDQNVDLFWR